MRETRPWSRANVLVLPDSLCQSHSLSAAVTRLMTETRCVSDLVAIQLPASQSQPSTGRVGVDQEAAVGGAWESVRAELAYLCADDVKGRHRDLQMDFGWLTRLSADRRRGPAWRIYTSFSHVSLPHIVSVCFAIILTSFVILFQWLSLPANSTNQTYFNQLSSSLLWSEITMKD